MIDISTDDLTEKFMQMHRSFIKATSREELTLQVENAIEDLMPLEYTGLYLWDSDLKCLKLIIAKGFSFEEKINAEKTAMDRHPGTVFKTGKMMYIPDTLIDPDHLSSSSPRSFDIRCRLYLPIIANDHVIGAFGVVSSTPHYFGPDSISAFRFICQMAGSNFYRLEVEKRDQESRELVNKLSLIATETDSAVIITDPRGKIEWVNKSFEKMTGYSINESIGHTPGSILQGKESDLKVRKMLRDAVLARNKIKAEIINYRKDKKPYRVQIQIYPIFGLNGELKNFISLQQDITEEYNTNRRIQEQQDTLEAIIKTLPDKLFIIDRNLNIELEYAHEDENTISRLPRPKTLDDCCTDVISKNIVANHIFDVLDSKASKSIEFSYEKDGELKYMEARSAPFKGNRVIMLVRDITRQMSLRMERDHQEKLNQKALESLNEQNRKLLNFSYIVSHNIRSHSSNIGGFANILASENKDPALSDFVAGIMRSSELLDTTLKYLNDLINIQSRKGVAISKLKLSESVNRSLSALAFEVRGHEIQIINKISDNFEINAFHVYLDSIILNLISNSIKYRSSDRKTIITIDCGETSSEQWFSVCDNGLGMNLSLYGSKLFGMFNTFHHAENSRGLGLFIVKNQVEAMNGKIEVKSEENQGTCFTIYIPKS
jgi:PAS domain S-box-containing protein